MDPKLAEIYGTNEVSEYDVEKLAAAELAEELSESDDANIDGMTEDDVEALAAQVLTEEQGEEYVEDDDSLEKISEADYLGRVMAHSYVQELRGIEKQAAEDSVNKHRGAANIVGGSVAGEKEKGIGRGNIGVGQGPTMRERMGHMKHTLKGIGHRIAAPFSGTQQAAKLMSKLDTEGLSAAEKLTARKDILRRGKALAKRNKYIAGGVGAATLAAGGAMAMKKHKEKRSSAIDTLAERRALEILEMNGIDPSQLGQEKVSSAEDVLVDTVEQRAWDILSQYGFSPADE